MGIAFENNELFDISIFLQYVYDVYAYDVLLQPYGAHYDDVHYHDDQQHQHFRIAGSNILQLSGFRLIALLQ